jgi:hypothetical protein
MGSHSLAPAPAGAAPRRPRGSCASSLGLLEPCGLGKLELRAVESVLGDQLIGLATAARFSPAVAPFSTVLSSSAP